MLVKVYGSAVFRVEATTITVDLSSDKQCYSHQKFGNLAKVVKCNECKQGYYFA